MLLSEIINKKNLYVCRNLLNHADIKKWAKKQGFDTCVPDGEMHVTIIYSKKEIDWNATKPLKNDITIKKNKKHPRTLKKFGEKKDVVVLTFYSKDLSKRHDEFMNLGCSSDFTFKAHVTLTYDGKDIDIAGMVPYEGDLVFGPEIFSEINKNFSDGFEEEVLGECLNLNTISYYPYLNSY